MKLRFESQQEYQIDAVQAVVDVFEGQPLRQGAGETIIADSANLSIAFTERGIANNLLLSPEALLANVQAIQARHEIPVSKCLIESISDDRKTVYTPLNITVEMETGTGKSYTFIRTIYELNRAYGFCKFVIVVPSVAIREGAVKNLQITHEHFQELYGKPPINFTLYDSAKLTALRNFATSNAIQVLVINVDSFTTDKTIINTVRETGVKPIEYIQATRPIVIVDEPQNMETDTRRAAIHNLNPMCTLRYSATHRNLYNLVYSLNPVQAYDQGLVKQIEVDGIVADEDYNTPYVELLSIVPSKGRKQSQAKVRMYVARKEGIGKKELTITFGDDLYWLSGNHSPYKDGYSLTTINYGSKEVVFANGRVVGELQTAKGLGEQVIKYMIERTVIHHFEKEVRYWKRGNTTDDQVKVLTLFFVDKVANYRAYDAQGNAGPGVFAEWFEEIFARQAADYRQKYPDMFRKMPPEAYFDPARVHESDLPVLHPDYWNASRVHNGYFSQDKKRQFVDTKEGNSTKADNDTYSLIMKDKERLLSFDEPLRFIFSHSALREGWDNPNVFQICTLSESRSEIRKRQEIGRGLRLSVDRTGQRVQDKRVNVLTVVANETYQAFSEGLQREIQEETSVEFSGRIANARQKERARLNKELTPENYPLFFELWERIKQRTRYRVAFSTEELIQRAAYNLRDTNQFPQVKRPLLISQTAELSITAEGVSGRVDNTTVKRTDIVNYQMPDVYAYIQSKERITRSTISEIILKSERFQELAVNPQQFMDYAVAAIKQALITLQAKKDGVKYECINGSYYEMSLFAIEEETYKTQLYPVTKPDKTLFDHVICDSGIEHEFAKDCEAEEGVKFYFKLPPKFEIPTPVGEYRPDWGVVFENDERVYLVVETKSTFNPLNRRIEENVKIQCAEEHFAALGEEGVIYKTATAVSDLRP